MIEIASAAMPQLVFRRRCSLDPADDARPNMLPAPIITTSAPKNPIPSSTDNTPAQRAILRSRLRCSFRRLTNTRRRRSNPHSSPQRTGALPTRGFLPWRFSNAGPASARRQAPMKGRHPKTFTKADLRRAGRMAYWPPIGVWRIVFGEPDLVIFAAASIRLGEKRRKSFKDRTRLIHTLRDWVHRFNEAGPDGLWTIGRRAGAASVGGAKGRTRGDRRNRPEPGGRRRCALAARRSSARHQGALRRRLSRTPCRNAVEAPRLLPRQRAPAPPGQNAEIVEAYKKTSRRR